MEHRGVKTDVPRAKDEGGMTTTTTTTTELYPEEVGKIEVFDVEFARALKAHPDIPKEERDKLKRYLKKCENVNHVRVVYKLGKLMRTQHLNLGRLCASEGIGLQTFSRDVRAALAGRYYFDVDVVNAQPTIILQYCEREGWECSALRRYVETREEVLEEMERNLGIERWEAKQRVISLLNGGSSEGLTPFLTRDLAPEVRRILQNVWAKNADALKWLKSQPNHIGKGMSHTYQTEERKVLMAMDRAFARRGRSLDTLIHDGGLVRKRDGETELPRGLLREVEADVLKETGYSVRLAIKSLETTIEREGDTEGEYKEKKRMWEETGWKGAIHFKLRSPPCFIALFEGVLDQLSRADILQNEENNTLADGELFIKKWLTDPQMREYNRLVFAPKRDVPEGCFNLFQGFHNIPKAGADFSPYQLCLRLIANNDDIVFNYLENWVAHVIQKPHIKTKIAICVQGEQGVGKDSFWDAVGDNIIGKSYYLSTMTPENDIFAKFNARAARKILVKFEEANFQTNKENASKLKGLITSERGHVEKKGHDPIELDDFTNIVMTTNAEIPVVNEETDRRFMLVKASSERRGQTDWWWEIHQRLKDPEVASAYHHYLLHKDISNFVPWDPRVVPHTQYYHDVKQSFLPYHARYFQRQIELDDDESYPREWTAYRLFTAMKETAPAELRLSETRFGRDLRVYLENGCLTKERSGGGNKYTANIRALRAFLVQKGWWVDY